ncbi:MAG: hypothetical protein QXL34_07140 [Thermosphaera sp.]
MDTADLFQKVLKHLYFGEIDPRRDHTYRFEEGVYLLFFEEGDEKVYVFAGEGYIIVEITEHGSNAIFRLLPATPINIKVEITKDGSNTSSSRHKLIFYLYVIMSNRGESKVLLEVRFPFDSRYLRRIYEMDMKKVTLYYSVNGRYSCLDRWKILCLSNTSFLEVFENKKVIEDKGG